MNALPVVGVTMGDGAGVGPEIIAKTVSRPDLADICRMIVIGDREHFSRAIRLCNLDLECNVIEYPKQAAYRTGSVDIIDVGGVPPGLPFGELSADAGEAAFQFIRRAVELASAFTLDAICTAPLNKEALHLAGHPYPGHTEILAELTNVPEVSMLLSSRDLRVVHVTTHIGLLDAIDRIDSGLVYRTIERGHLALTNSGDITPRIAVCGINPHAGENGLFGRGEEASKIAPAIYRARQAGMNVEGPLPADTAFFRARRGEFDMVVAMYHDQGHAPVKALGIDMGVNVTLGLPFIRTSVDHGTAFDIAGTGTADEASLIEAIRLAADLAHQQPR